MAQKVREANRSTNTATTVSSAVALNATTSTTIAALNVARIFFRVHNNGNQTVWIKLQSAATDNDKKGIELEPGDHLEMLVNSIYTGEISGISQNGTPDVFYTEY